MSQMPPKNPVKTSRWLAMTKFLQVHCRQHLQLHCSDGELDEELWRVVGQVFAQRRAQSEFVSHPAAPLSIGVASNLFRIVTLQLEMGVSNGGPVVWALLCETFRLTCHSVDLHLALKVRCSECARQALSCFACRTTCSCRERSSISCEYSMTVNDAELRDSPLHYLRCDVRVLSVRARCEGAVSQGEM